MKKRPAIRVRVFKNGESIPKLTEEERKERDDLKRTNVVKALFGTCIDPDYAPRVSFISKENENRETGIMKSRCTHCSDVMKWKIRNRNSSTGVYRITRKEAEEFSKVGRFDLSDDKVFKQYIIITNFCECCKNKKEIHAELVRFTDFLSRFPQFKKHHPSS
ncbi:hypothetical protein COB64_04435 [Candidatus Wolfebacteria bacterium]|nr:MAG: hypothetical protein COB64_04435 [Candidatus Wolfebacteria bacterium]